MQGGWTEELADELQEAVDDIFGQDTVGNLEGLQFSFTIADPHLEDCPLIGCSTGFTAMCGYTMHEIVGRNCRFLVDPVPDEYVDPYVRKHAREFCKAIREGTAYEIPEDEIPEWVPVFDSKARGGGAFFAQVNARKDGSLFRNMFYLKPITLSDKDYLIGLQTELPPEDDAKTTEIARKACRQLDINMLEVERILAKLFWLGGPMRRQDDPDPCDGFVE